MSYYQVSHTDKLSGDIVIQGSKNASLPTIAAAILNKGTTVIKNCPDISDVRNMIKILGHLGCKCEFKKNILVIESENVNLSDIPKEDVSKLRSSVVLIGALLGRNNEVEMSYPGGCNIGQRKIDVHIEALREIGYEVIENENGVRCFGKIYRDSYVRLRLQSVGATENTILASVISDGYIVRISNAAREPEIVNLCNCLNEMGAKVYGAGNDEIIVEGVKNLHDGEVIIDADRIVAGTYMAAVTAIGGKVYFKNIEKNFDNAILKELKKFGMEYLFDDDKMCVEKNNNKLIFERDITVSTGTYPKFPPDMQSQIMSLMAKGRGTGVIVENIFEKRFGTAEQLNKMGAKINLVSEKIAIVKGVEKLKGTTVEALDLRGGAALIIAGLMADEITYIYNGEYIQRGYESIENDLSCLGANILLYNK